VLYADLEEISPQFEPVVDEESDRDQWPHWTEERKEAELDDHLSDVVLNVVGFAQGLLAGASKEAGLSGVVCVRVFLLVSTELRLRGLTFSPPLPELCLQPRQYEFFAKIRYLTGYREGN
jgi:hypothetical protein